MSQKTIAEREKLINEVEDLILRGINRPAAIVRMVAGIGNRQTAARYIAAVTNRWKVRNGVDNESHRQRLLAETQEIHRRAYAIVAQMSNLETQGSASGCAAATALGVALKALERQAKLLGLDSEKRIIDAGKDTLDALRGAKLKEIDFAIRAEFGQPDATDQCDATPTGPEVDPIREMYGLKS